MKNECNIIRDLLPLYVENMVSPDTVEFVEAHLKNCAECRKEYEREKEPEEVQVKMDVVPLVNLKQKMRRKKIQTVAFTAILAVALLVSAFAFLSAPEYFPYSDDLMSITENEDESITITLDEKVTDYSCMFYAEPNAANDPAGKKQGYYHMEAWTSLWDKWFSNRGIQSVTIQPKQGVPLTVYYASNNSEADVCIYGHSESAGVQTLPRLALGYYLIFVGIGFAGLVVAWFFFKYKESIRIWIERLILYPVSYAMGHFAVLRFRTISYSMTRDFTLIIFLSVLIYCGLLLAHNIYLLRKELRRNDTNRMV